MTPPTKARLIAAIAFPLLLLHGTPGPCAQAASTIEGMTIQMDHISVRTVGHGSPVILIPGLSSPRATWDGVWPELAKTHRVHLVQINGFGGDDPRANLKPGVLDGVVADLDRYIAQNKLAGAAVVGHSMGGTVALMLAKAHPADVGKLMLVDTIPFTADIFAPGMKLTVDMVQPRAATMRDRIAAAYGKPVDVAAARQIAQTQALKPEAQARVVSFVTAADPRVSAEATYEDLTIDLRPAMTAIQTPITLVYPWSDAPGRGGQAGADAFYRSEYAGAPHVSFVPVGDSGHFVMLDQPAAFMTAVTAFLGG